MIATISLPGGSNFTFKHVKNEAEAQAWRAAWLAEVGETQETLNAVRQGQLLTDAEARRVKHSDGSGVYTRPGVGLMSEG